MTGASGAVADRPAWVREEDELPHRPPGVELWCENYLSYLYAPDAEVGVWLHMCHRGGPPELWDEKFLVALPGDRYLAAKAFSRGYPDRGPRTSGLALRCEQPFAHWTMEFTGAARLLDGDELRSGPVADGPHVPVELELDCRAFGPAYDFGEEKLDQSWGTGHYEQPLRYRGRLVYDGVSVELAGTGLRDHSWGPRDYAQIGSTAWIHGQFPGSGRTFMAVQVTGKPPRRPFVYGVIGDTTGVSPAGVGELPVLRDRARAADGYELELTAADGTASSIGAEVLSTLYMAFAGPAEIVLGTHRGPAVNHDYVIAFTRFEWDGEVGFGVTDRTIETANQ